MCRADGGIEETGAEKMDYHEPSQGRKIEILNAAANLMSKRGLQDLSLENLAVEAGLSHQVVRYHYSDLEVLMVDLCDHLANGYREILVAGIVDIGEVERLDLFLDFFYDLAEGHSMPANLEVYDALIAYSVGSKALRDRMCDQYTMLGQVVTHELAIAHPELSGSACEELSFMFVSMMHAHWSFVASLGFSRQHSPLARKAIGRLINSYVKDAPSTPVMKRPWSRKS